MSDHYYLPAVRAGRFTFTLMNHVARGWALIIRNEDTRTEDTHWVGGYRDAKHALVAQVAGVLDHGLAAATYDEVTR